MLQHTVETDTGAAFAIPVSALPSLEPAIERALRKRVRALEAEQAARLWAADWHEAQANAERIEFIENQPWLVEMRRVLLMRARAA